MNDIKELFMKYSSLFFKGILIFSAAIVLVSAFHTHSFSFGSFGAIGHHDDQADIQDLSKDLKDLKKTVDDLAKQNKIILQKIAPEEDVCNEELANAIAEKTGCTKEEACKMIHDLKHSSNEKCEISNNNKSSK